MWYVISRRAGESEGCTRFITKHSKQAAEQWLAKNAIDGAESLVIKHLDIVHNRNPWPVPIVAETEIDDRYWNVFDDDRDTAPGAIDAVAITDRFEAGTPAPYRFVYGRRLHQVHGLILLASNEAESMADTLKSGIPDLWYSFERLEFIDAGDTLPIDLVATDATRWDMYSDSFSVSDFVDNLVSRLECSEVAR